MVVVSYTLVNEMQHSAFRHQLASENRIEDGSQQMKSTLKRI
jgi:hypothetical protein